MKPIYIIVILFFVSYVMLGIALWLIKCKDLDLRKETISRKIWESKFNNLEKEFIKRDSERKEIIENLRKENRSLREELYKAKHSKYSHRVIFKNGINDEYIDEEHFDYIDAIIEVNKNNKSYININNNLFKITDIDCVIKLNKE
jgi:hypothetical protein